MKPTVLLYKWCDFASQRSTISNYLPYEFPLATTDNGDKFHWNDLDIRLTAIVLLLNVYPSECDFFWISFPYLSIISFLTPGLIKESQITTHYLKMYWMYSLFLSHASAELPHPTQSYVVSSDLPELGLTKKSKWQKNEDSASTLGWRKEEATDWTLVGFLMSHVIGIDWGKKLGINSVVHIWFTIVIVLLFHYEDEHKFYNFTSSHFWLVICFIPSALPNA